VQSRTLEELLLALKVSDASAVIFGKLPVVSKDTPRTPVPATQTYAAFSDHEKLEVTLEECLILRAAGARDARPSFTPPVT